MFGNCTITVFLSSLVISKIRADDEGAASGFLDFFKVGVLGDLDESHLASDLVELEDGHVGDKHVDDALASEWQGALREDLVVALRCVLHRHDQLLGPADEVHGAPHALDHLARDNPVGKVATLGDLEAAQDTHVHLAAADHSERLARTEERGAWEGTHSLLACIDEVSIHHVLRGEGAQA